MGYQRATSVQQIEYTRLYQNGVSVSEIAKRYGVCNATVYRVLGRARRIVCPFSVDCDKCQLEECAFKPEYKVLINTTVTLRKYEKKSDPDGIPKTRKPKVKKEEPTSPEEKFVYNINNHDAKKEDSKPVQEEPPKRKRGRPRKSDTVASAKVSKNTDEVNNEMTNTKPHSAAPAVKEHRVQQTSVREPTYKPWEHPKGKKVVEDYPKIEHVPMVTRETPPKPQQKQIEKPNDTGRIEPKYPPVPFKHKELMMTDGEIRSSFRNAKDQYEQIKILAQLNGCDRQLILDILGIPMPPRPVRKRYDEIYDW